MQLKRLTRSVIAAVSAVALSGALLTGCDLDVPDLNNPPLDDLRNNPTPTLVNASTTGLLVGYRGNYAAQNGYVNQLAVLGREGYTFDSSDPRYVSELLTRSTGLSQGSPYGGNFWAFQYANIKQAHIVIEAKDKVELFTAEQKLGISGFAKTIIAAELLSVINTHDTNGAVIDTDREIEDGLGAIASKEETFAKIVQWLDEGKADLAGAGAAFTFPLSSGFRDFATPANFLKFNRALRARVAVYMKDYPAALTALGESFINTEAPLTVLDLEVGAYHSYSTASGDTPNGLIGEAIYAHPSFEADAQLKPGSTTETPLRDDRFVRKIVKDDPAPAGASRGIPATHKFTLYGRPGAPNPNAPVAIIRNEELILLRAEAKWGSNDLAGAEEDLNIIRQVSGGLPALTPGQTADQLEDEILYNRRFSLMFEGGHRWIDMRRFGRIQELKMDDPPPGTGMPVIPPVIYLNVRYPIPLDECNARPGEPRCALGSFDPAPAP